MFAETSCGVYGKLPVHGDFVHRNLSANSIQSWDEWLQGFVAGTREQLAGDWLDMYLSAPVWRFAFSAGVLDENSYLGVMIPSVDRVGRYFPLTLLEPIQPSESLLEVLELRSNWFSGIESLLLESLDGQIDIDNLMFELSKISTDTNTAYKNIESFGDGKNAIVNMEFEEQSPSSVYPHLMESLLISNFSSFSLWTTSGSDFVEPCTMITQGLPKIGQVSAMLDGHWNSWGWNFPYQLLAESVPLESEREVIYD